MKTKDFLVILFVIVLILGINTYFFSRDFTSSPLKLDRKIDYNVIENNYSILMCDGSRIPITTVLDVYESREEFEESGYWVEREPSLAEFDFDHYNMLISYGRKIFDFRYSKEATLPLTAPRHPVKITFDDHFDNNHVYVYRIADIPPGEGRHYVEINGFKVPLNKNDLLYYSMDKVLADKKKADIIYASVILAVFLAYIINDWRKRKKIAALQAKESDFFETGN